MSPRGSVEVSRVPLLFPAIQSAVEAHPIACKALWPTGAPTVRQAPAPPVGSVEVTMFPSWPTATQKSTREQVMAPKLVPSGASMACQSVSPPVGLVETRILPRLASISPPLPPPIRRSETATQSVTLGQEIPLRWVLRPPASSISTVFHAE